MMFEPKTKQAKKGLMELPVEIILEIFKRLPIKSVYRIRCASKTLLEVVDSPLFVSLHKLALIATNAVAEEPLMLRLVDDKHFETWGKLIMAVQSINYDDSKGKVILSEILYAAHHDQYTIPFVFNNLFCFMNTSQEFFFLIDPFRGEVLRLPACKEFSKDGRKRTILINECFGMGFDNITGTYKIVRVTTVWYCSSMYLAADVHVLGTSSWHEIPATFGPFWEAMTTWRSNNSVCAYGDAHWLFHQVATEGTEGENSIVSFDFTKEEFYSTPTPAALPNSEKKLECLKFITLRGSLAIVDASSLSKIDIWVMKDYNKKEWTREYTIDLQMLEPNIQKLFRKSNNCGEWENGIFFLWAEIDDVSIVNEVGTFFFDLRNVPVTWVECPNEQDNDWRGCGRILSLKNSWLSLKSFGNLIQVSEPGSQNLLDFSANYLWHHSRKPGEEHTVYTRCPICTDAYC